MKTTRSYNKLLLLAENLQKTNNSQALCQLLGIPIQELSMMALSPQYELFSIPKKDGSPRWIEAPSKPLKKVQRLLNQHLQALYFFHRSTAAYGFVINSKQDPAPRNILSNAQRHRGCRHLYNADIEDFFHSIKSAAVFRCLTQRPFRFDDESADLIVRLCTHNGRLPMGTPTSPALSNWVCHTLDQDLEQLAQRQGWVYTRYADDMSFSSQKTIDKTMQAEIASYCQAYGFHFNPDKIKYFKPKEPKEITGLTLLGDTISVKESFLEDIRQDIQRLQDVFVLMLRYKGKPAAWLKRYKQQIEGKLNFLSQIKGERHLTTQQLHRQYRNAQKPELDFLAYSWTDFPYV